MGRRLAEGAAATTVLLRRQMLVERLLVDIVGVPSSHAHVEAVRIGPAVSARVEARIAGLLGDPGTVRTATRSPGPRTPPGSPAS